MLQERELFQLLGSFIANEISKQLQPVREELTWLKQMVELNKASVIKGGTEFIERIVRVEKVLSDMPVPTNGKDGKDGVDGTNGLDGQPGAEGAAGKDGTSVTLDEIKPLVCEAIDSIVAGWEKPKDGKDGRDGVNGADGKSICLDDVRGWLSDLVDKAVGDLPDRRHITGGIIDRDGALALLFSDGVSENLGRIVGHDGKDCDMEAVGRQVAEYLATIQKPADGLGIEHIEYDGERTFTFANERVNRSFMIPFPLYRGLWKAGSYQRGDEVTSDGSQFIAMRDTDKEPGTIDSGWRLACKRGRDGKKAHNGASIKNPAQPNGVSR